MREKTGFSIHSCVCRCAVERVWRGRGGRVKLKKKKHNSLIALFGLLGLDWAEVSSSPEIRRWSKNKAAVQMLKSAPDSVEKKERKKSS